MDIVAELNALFEGKLHDVLALDMLAVHEVINGDRDVYHLKGHARGHAEKARAAFVRHLRIEDGVTHLVLLNRFSLLGSKFTPDIECEGDFAAEYP
jgi:hypothetical protein